MRLQLLRRTETLAFIEFQFRSGGLMQAESTTYRVGTNASYSIF